ncbi:MAG: hypothetical protein RLZZ04_248 [Cyanobacteriota bacterium]|jgi:hypothetical protein
MISICIELNWKTALQAANALIFQHTGKYLRDIEIVILHGAWNNYTYAQIAEAKGYTSSYLCKDIGHSLWKNLSTALKVKVSKRNFKAALRREWQKYTQAILNKNRNQLGKLLTTDNITLFEGLIALDSTIYLERCVPLAESYVLRSRFANGLASRHEVSAKAYRYAYPLGQPQTTIETTCCEAILKPGSLIRIEGAKWMGKTSLVNQILDRGNLQAQRTVYLDFDTIEREIIQDINKLLIWLSTIISHQLNIENKLKNYWSKSISSCNDDCTAYFEDYILTKVKSGIILALDNIDCLFYNQEVAEKFLKLLCSWHEQAESNYHWSKLKLIITQSTKVSISFNIDRFFSNTATPVLLEEFDFQQVKTLAGFYQLDWNDWEILRLMNEVGGNPYLVRLAMYQAKIKNLTLEH